MTKTMVMGGYSNRSMQSYVRDPDLPLHDLTAEAITQYMFYLNKTLGCSRDKVAISNHRIKKIDAKNRVTFVYKDYAAGGVRKRMRLDGAEFLRRFEQHILPRGFCKIRSCGLYANHGRRTRVA